MHLLSSIYRWFSCNTAAGRSLLTSTVLTTDILKDVLLKSKLGRDKAAGLLCALPEIAHDDESEHLDANTSLLTLLGYVREHSTSAPSTKEDVERLTPAFAELLSYPSCIEAVRQGALQQLFPSVHSLVPSLRELNNKDPQTVASVLSSICASETNQVAFPLRPDHHYVHRIFGTNAHKIENPIDKTDFRRLADRARENERTLLYYDRLYTLFQAVQLLSRVREEHLTIVEVGVYRGGSLRFLVEAAKINGSERLTALGFDTFVGHSAKDIPQDGEGKQVEGLFSDTSFESVREYLKPYPEVKLVPGRIQETFNCLGERSIDILHLDVDLYAPTLFVLQTYADKLSVGGIIVVDDFGFKTCPYLSKAVEEFLVDHPNYHQFSLLTGQALLIKIAECSAGRQGNEANATKRESLELPNDRPHSAPVTMPPVATSVLPDAPVDSTWQPATPATATVIVCSCNRLRDIQKALAALDAKFRHKIDVVVVDAASTDGSKEYLRSLKHIRLVEETERIGQAKSLNRIMRSVSTPYVCWLSDDNILVPDVLDAGIDILNRDPKLGIVGLKVKDTAGPFKDEPFIGGVYDCGILNINQGLCRTEVLQRIGYFDDRFSDYGIDTDLVTRILLEGYDAVCTKAIAIYHDRQHESAGGAFAYEDRKRRQEAGRNLYDLKYGCMLRSQRFGGAIAFLKNGLLALCLRYERLARFQAGRRPALLGQPLRYWRVICKARFISIFDWLKTRRQDYHLRQSIPQALREQYVKQLQEDSLKAAADQPAEQERSVQEQPRSRSACDAEATV